MDKQIEEMRNDLSNAWHSDIIIGDKFKDVAEKFTKLGYRKIPEGAVVLTSEEYEKIYDQAEATVLSNIADGGTSCHWCMNKHEEIGYKQGSKETAEKFAERLKADVSEDDELHEALNYYLKRDYFEYIDERCKEITEGE